MISRENGKTGADIICQMSTAAVRECFFLQSFSVLLEWQLRARLLMFSAEYSAEHQPPHKFRRNLYRHFSRLAEMLMLSSHSNLGALPPLGIQFSTQSVAVHSTGTPDMRSIVVVTLADAFLHRLAVEMTPTKHFCACHTSRRSDLFD